MDRLRRDIFSKRKSMDHKAYELKSAVIAEKCINIISDQTDIDILTYSAINKEVDLSRMHEYVLKNFEGRGYRLYFPVTYNKTIAFFRIDSVDELEAGTFNILEPRLDIRRPDRVFVNERRALLFAPGLLFDVNGNRIGYGAGYYDRFLQNKNILKFGVAFDFQVKDRIESNPWDIAMDGIISG